MKEYIIKRIAELKAHLTWLQDREYVDIDMILIVRIKIDVLEEVLKHE